MLPGAPPLPAVMFCVLEFELPRLPALAISPRIEALLVANGLSGRPFAASGYDEPSLTFLAGTEAQYYRYGSALGNWLRANPTGVVMVESRALPAFESTKPATVKVGVVEGYDYSNGKTVKVGIYRVK